MSVTAAKGFLAAGVSAGIKKGGRPDLSLLVSARPCAAAGVFTPHRFRAAPVDICAARLAATGGRARAVIATSGCANAMTGAAGRRDALRISAAVERTFGFPAAQVLVASTGAIGRRLPVDKIVRAVPAAARVLGCGPAAGLAAARGIMTTDKRPKQAVARFRDGAAGFTVGGMAKGVGMVSPRMATVLVFLTTDAELGSGPLRAALRAAVGPTLNSMTVDGQMSTNDTAIIMANGLAASRPLSGPGLARFGSALREVCASLARQLIADGEGASRLIEVAVRGARNDGEASRAARAVADSMLVKTAFYGAQANWGRIAQAIGACPGIRFSPRGVRVAVAGVPAIRAGVVLPPTPRVLAALRRPLVRVDISLGGGRGRAKVLTCDLTEGYVRENAGYLT